MTCLRDSFTKTEKKNKAGYTGQDGAPSVIISLAHPELYQTYPQLYQTYPKLY